MKLKSEDAFYLMFSYERRKEDKEPYHFTLNDGSKFSLTKIELENALGLIKNCFPILINARNGEMRALDTYNAFPTLQNERVYSAASSYARGVKDCIMEMCYWPTFVNACRLYESVTGINRSLL